jgi:fatty-acyl-CoA synthase
MILDGHAWWGAEPGPPLVGLTVGALLDEAAAAHGDRLAVAMSAYADFGFNVRWTYAELQRGANDLAARLRRAGIGAGDRVVVWAPNVPQWIMAEFAVAKAGAILVTINPTFTAAEAAYIVEDSAAKGCLFLPEFLSFQIWARLKQILPHLPELRVLLSLGEPVDGVPSVGAPEEAGTALSDGGWAGDIAVSAHDTAQIQYTSGTTGAPKGAMLTHHSLVNNALLTMHRWQITSADTWCNPMPFFHTTGCGMVTLGVVAAGAVHCPIVWFDADRVLDTIAAERCTILETVPTTLIAVLERQHACPRDLSSLRVVGTSGAPAGTVLRDRTASELGAELRILYGLTEASPTITCTAPSDPPQTVGATVGRPLPWTEVRIARADGGVTGVGVPGELQARGYLVMAGYLNRPSATAAAIGPDGWLRTGDIAIMDADGYVSIVARIKDVIIRGGENIYPAEIEDQLRQHPGVADACVVPVASEFFGEESCAFVLPAAGFAIGADEIRSFLRPRLSYQKIPRYFVTVRDLPRTASGKVKRYVLREKAPRELGLDSPPAGGPGNGGSRAAGNNQEPRP